MRFDVSGELQLIDASGRPYWVTGQGQGVFAAPFTLAVQDDGKIVIKDANGQPKWYSHWLSRIKYINNIIIIYILIIF